MLRLALHRSGHQHREQKGFDHMRVALSVGVQKMVRSDKACAGVMFSIDTDSGFPEVVVIEGSWGPGEMVVQGSVSPDSFVVFKPLLVEEDARPILRKKIGSKQKKMIYSRAAGRSTRTLDTSAKERRSLVLTDEEILRLARWAVAIERHYGKPMDMEWAKDGDSKELFIDQARPETVQSRKQAGVLRTYRLKEKGEVPRLEGSQPQDGRRGAAGAGAGRKERRFGRGRALRRHPVGRPGRALGSSPRGGQEGA